MRDIKRSFLPSPAVTRRSTHGLLLVFLAFVLLGCDGATVVGETQSRPEETPVPVTTTMPTDTPVPPADTVVTQPVDTPMPLPTDTSVPVADTPPPPPTDTPVPVPTDTPAPVATVAPLFYNLPPATLTSATGLYASPNRAELIVPATIPAGETVYVMGRNGTGSHLRVVWSTGVGWVPVSFTNYNGRQDLLKPLPIFTREPPACAVPITTQFGLSSTWTSDIKQRIAVVVDLFRSRYGEFPASSLSLTVNGVEVEESRREIVEKGQFSLKDVVFTVPQDVQPGDTVGYRLETSSDEPLTFMATIFSVPQNCQWEID